MTSRADPDLSSAYRACRRMQRRHAPTFYSATMRRRARCTQRCTPCSGRARRADQLVDAPGRSPDPVLRRRALDQWQAELERGIARGSSCTW